MGANRYVQVVVTPKGGEPRNVKGLYVKNEILYADMRFAGKKGNTWRYGQMRSTGERNCPETANRWGGKLENLRLQHRAHELTDEFVAATFKQREDFLPSGMHFDALCDEWKTKELPIMRNKRDEPLAKKTKYYYGVNLNCCWKPSFIDEDLSTKDATVYLPISKITKEHIQEVLTVGALADAKPKTRGNYLSVLRMVFDYAVKKEYLRADKNPMIGIKISKKLARLSRDKVFHPDDIDTLLAAIRAEASREHGIRTMFNQCEPEVAGELYYNYFDFAFFTGLRPAEQIELRWKDIELDRKMMTISRSLVGGEVKVTKTGDTRVVNLNPRALACLERQRALAPRKPNDQVFMPPTADAFNDLQVQGRMWNRVVDALYGKKAEGERRDRPQYATRHTSVSLNLMMGKLPRWVAAQHGHSPQVMEAVYAHWIHVEGDDGEKDGEIVVKIRQLYGMPLPMTGDLAMRRLMKEVEELRQQLAERELRKAA